MVKTVYISPEEKKKSNLIITWACKINEIELPVLKKDTDRTVVGIRQQCFYLIKVNTDLTPDKIAYLFGMSRQRICYGIEQAEIQKKLYSNVLRSMGKIIEKANEEAQGEFVLMH